MPQFDYSVEQLHVWEGKIVNNSDGTRWKFSVSCPANHFCLSTNVSDSNPADHFQQPKEALYLRSLRVQGEVKRHFTEAKRTTFFPLPFFFSKLREAVLQWRIFFFSLPLYYTDALLFFLSPFSSLSCVKRHYTEAKRTTFCLSPFSSLSCVKRHFTEVTQLIMFREK